MALGAHILGIPVEETATSLLPLVGFVLLAVRVGLARHTRRGDRAGDRDTGHTTPTDT
jgi:hypothetical protein